MGRLCKYGTVESNKRSPKDIWDIWEIFYASERESGLTGSQAFDRADELTAASVGSSVWSAHLSELGRGVASAMSGGRGARKYWKRMECNALAKSCELTERLNLSENPLTSEMLGKPHGSV